MSKRLAVLITAAILPALTSALPAQARAAHFVQTAPGRQSLARAGLGLDRRFGSFGSALVGSAPAGKGPSVAAVDATTHTIYVANGSNADGPNAGGDTVSVIDARHCDARDVSRCKGPWPTIRVGDLPAGVAVDQKTDTVYVTDFGDNTVSVFNGATCNAVDTSGCGQKPATVPVGPAPGALFDDPASHTVYVVNCGSACGLGGPPSTIVSMLDTATCNAADLAGCPATPPPTADVGALPANVDVNQATHTVYVTTVGTHRAQNGWAVFNASTCNAVVQSGCGRIGRLIGDPIGPFAGVVDPANDTLYTANFDNTISAFGLRHCRAGDLDGCASDKPGTVTPFPNPAFGGPDLFVAVDAALHSVYVTYQKDDSVLVVNTHACNGTHPAGCATLRPPAIHTGSDVEGIALDARTQTVYTVNEVDSTVSVIDAARCNAADTTGCDHRPPAAAVTRPVGLAADPAAHTAYIAAGPDTVSMINTRACNARHPGGCSSRWASVRVAAAPMAVAVSRATHTAYVASYGTGPAGTVAVLDTRTCNVTYTVGCARPSVLRVPGGNPDDLAVNPATGTLYVATITARGPDLISVFNAATCNATVTTGCGQAPAVLKAGPSAGGNSMLNLAINPATNTLYATNLLTGGPRAFTGSNVYVFNGATCDATHRTGCGQTPATIEVPGIRRGSTPVGIAANPATDTIYTADLNVGEAASTVGVINGATCNGADHAGCGQTPATVKTGFGTQGVTIDTATGRVYANNIQDTSVSVINGNTCNGHHTTGCHRTPPKIAVADYPGATQGALRQVGNSPEPIAVDPAACTAYVETITAVSVIPANPCGDSPHAPARSSSAAETARAGTRLAAGARAVSGGTWGTAEEVPGTAALNTGGNAGVLSVSCPSADNCSAGGNYNTAGRVFVVTELNGTWGKAEEIPGTAALNTGGQAQVSSVSCASAGNCSTVGGYADSSGHGQVFAANQVYGTWGKAKEVPGTAALDQGQSASVSSVSCASAGSCSAGGNYTQVTRHNQVHTQAFVVSEVHGTWAQAREVPGTGALNIAGYATVSSVSCASAGNCSAGGFYIDSSGNQQAFVASQVHGTWRQAREVPGTASLNQGGFAQVNSVSCTSAGNCTAGGLYNDRSHRGQAFVVTQTHGTWGQAREVPGTGALNAGGSAGVNGAAVYSVSCTSAGNCAAGGNYVDRSGHGQVFVATQAHGTWGQAREIPGTAALNTGGGGAIASVSCWSAGNCSAGGNYVDGSGHGQVFVATQAHGTWGQAREVPGSAVLNQGGFAEMASVSCAPAGTCSAGGFYSPSPNHLQAFVVNKA